MSQTWLQVLSKIPTLQQGRRNYQHFISLADIAFVVVLNVLILKITYQPLNLVYEIKILVRPLPELPPAMLK